MFYTKNVDNMILNFCILRVYPIHRESNGTRK